MYCHQSLVANVQNFFHHGEILGDPEQVEDANWLQAHLTSDINGALASGFGELSKFVAIQRTLQFGLASLLHHFDAAMHHHGVAISNDCADRHASSLLLSPALRSRKIIDLNAHVRVIYPWEGTDAFTEQCIMTLTGIPPHVVQLAQIKQLQEAVANISPIVLASVEKHDRRVNGTLSETRMLSLMQTILEEGQNRVLEEVRRLGGGTASQDEHMQQPVVTGLTGALMPMMDLLGMLSGFTRENSVESHLVGYSQSAMCILQVKYGTLRIR
jgi:hypothetical protein